MHMSNNTKRLCNRKTFIVLEGVDGTGKSTVARLLANDPDIEAIESPPFPFDSIKQSVLESAAPMARIAYFMAGNMQISARVTNPLQTKHLLCVRYVFSTLAYHSALENINATELQPLVQIFSRWITLPDAVIFLDVSADVQASRLRGRVDGALQSRLASSTSFQLRLRRAYDDVRGLFDVSWVDVDTSKIGPEEVAKRIRTTIHSF